MYYVIQSPWSCPMRTYTIFRIQRIVGYAVMSVDVVQGHCHVTGKYRGAAHSSCNLNYRQLERIPVFFHKLKGYDAQHIMSATRKFKHKKLTCIQQSHISFPSGKLDFIDTFQFMSTSLEKFVNNLAEECIVT